MDDDLYVCDVCNAPAVQIHLPPGIFTPGTVIDRKMVIRGIGPADEPLTASIRCEAHKITVPR